MEQINKVELRGNVGMVYLNKAGGRRAIRISLATNVGYHASDGSPVIETTWHNINAWEGKGMPDFDQIQKGTGLHVWGRIRSTRAQSSSGSISRPLTCIRSEKRER